jgi:gliding motility-associated-like protein
LQFFTKTLFLLCIGVLLNQSSRAQLVVTNVSDANALVQRLLGQGVTVSNISIKGHPAMTGFFNNLGGNNIGIDSGIVLTNGVAKTDRLTGRKGVDGDGFTAAGTVNAFNGWSFPGDGDLSAIVGDITNDACVLEFDFVPLGDSIRFNYVFSSEEYTNFSCSQFNDAFAFFISGPGITGLRNIALIPNTNLPVTINNINEEFCALFPQYFTNNEANTFFTHNGHVAMFTASSRVQPCETYHLKLVIADVSDDDLDSGVFLEAKSLSSNAVKIENNTQTDPLNNSYLVEGCSAGAFKITRPKAEPAPLSITLNYGGTAINGVDMQLLPAIVTIPANQTEITVNVVPIIDNTPEGIETIKIYALTGCVSGTPTDSAFIQIRDYDTLGINPDTAIICRNTTIQLTASPGYTTYQWDADPTLNNTGIRNPIASPVNHITTYYCTSTEGTCHGRDSSTVIVKQLQLISKTEINCSNASTGEIEVLGGTEWAQPVEYSLNNGAWQINSSFANLPVGVYTVKIRDATGCIDSLVVSITQLYPDLLINSIPVTGASCLGGADGSAAVNASGGKSPLLFSTDGINFQPGNVFRLIPGNYTVTVRDNNNCTATQNFSIPLDNTVTLEAGSDRTICEGKNSRLNTISNADSYVWTPALGLDNSTIKDPLASPIITTQYIVTATTGICIQKDTVTVFVNPAPNANAGADQTICFGQDARLNGSGGISYNWYPPSFLNDTKIASPVSERPSGSISYFLNVVDANGCYSLKRDTVIITVTRPAIVFAGRDTTLAMGQPLPLFATDVNNIGFNRFEWSPNFGLNDAFVQGPLTAGTRDIYYTVTARNSIGCEATDDIRIKVYRGPDIYVPNSFTPNGDGLNDVLRAIPVGVPNFHYFRVYNRWGAVVFTTNDPLRGWDGKINGNLQSTNTYVWMAEGVDYKGKLVQRKGTVSIVK